MKLIKAVAIVAVLAGVARSQSVYLGEGIQGGGVPVPSMIWRDASDGQIHCGSPECDRILPDNFSEHDYKCRTGFGAEALSRIISVEALSGEVVAVSSCQQENPNPCVSVKLSSGECLTDPQCPCPQKKSPCPYPDRGNGCNNPAVYLGGIDTTDPPHLELSDRYKRDSWVSEECLKTHIYGFSCIDQFKPKKRKHKAAPGARFQPGNYSIVKKTAPRMSQPTTLYRAFMKRLHQQANHAHLRRRRPSRKGIRGY